MEEQQIGKRANMHSTRLTYLCVITLLAAFSLGPVNKAFAKTAATTSEQRRVVASVETMFRSLDTNDQALLSSVTEPGFYLFDAGARFEPQSILALLGQMKASGKHSHGTSRKPTCTYRDRLHGSLISIAAV